MKKDVKELAWQLFEKTGSLAYYRLYKELDNIDKNRKE